MLAWFFRAQLNRGSVSYEALGEPQLAEIATQIRHYVDGSIPSIEVCAPPPSSSNACNLCLYGIMFLFSPLLVLTVCQYSSNARGACSIQDTGQVCLVCVLSRSMYIHSICFIM